jgi:hypothetical protein
MPGQKESLQGKDSIYNDLQVFQQQISRGDGRVDKGIATWENSNRDAADCIIKGGK